MGIYPTGKEWSTELIRVIIEKIHSQDMIRKEKNKHGTE